MMAEYWMPEYMPAFECKMGACRCCCCEGWDITVSLKEYYQLLSLPCSPYLRKRLDGAFHLSAVPSPEHYAQITPRFDGNCPLRLRDGRCGLQVECGEESLSAICRTYPRSFRYRGETFEAACANSCEQTLEMLLNIRAPLTFVKAILDRPALADDLRPQGQKNDKAVRLLSLQTLQNRKEPLERRLRRLGRVVAAFEQTGALALDNGELPAVPQEIPWILSIQHDLVSLMESMDSKRREEAPSIERALGLNADETVGEKAAAAYRAAGERLDSALPEQEIWMEQILVNHVFFEGFPYSDRQEDLHHAYMALCGTYALLRVLARGCETKQSFVDRMARAFRMIEHSRFDWNAAVVL
ncbi:MAG: YkgJ family cysteine cluster protein, partial [Clostridia bacterium]|nr:YkgJ family cysteine cluster protein [Clostridia bacterium]